MRQILKKLALTVGGLSIGVILSGFIIVLSGFMPLSASRIGLDCKLYTLLDSEKEPTAEHKVWGDMPLDQSMSEFRYVAPELKTRKEFSLALKEKSAEHALDGQGGGFYFGSAKDLFSPGLGVFDVQRVKSHLLKISNLNNIGISGSSLKQKIESLVNGVPVGAPVLGRLSSFFGKRTSPFGYQADFHTGIDIASIYNSPVVSSAEGEIVFSGHKGSYGKTVLIKHKNGLETLYAHLATIDVKEGQHVNRGQKIGLLGSSGRSTGPHLHYEVRLEGSPVDPISYIELAKIMNSMG